MPKKPPFWRPGVHAARRPFLLQRSRIAAAVRTWFEQEGFIEVDTAALQVSPGNETHLHAFATTLVGPDGEQRDLYLRTSPEFACKKLLAAGETRIFDFAKVFRNRERGPLHHPEFTLLEWYRTDEPYEILMEDCAALLRVAADTTGARSLSFRGRSIDPFLPPERITVAEAFAKFASIDLPVTVSGHAGDRDALAVQAERAGVCTAPDDTWGDVFSRIIVEKIEPNLGNGRATILYEYPQPQAALARAKPGSNKVAERFELYACGVELANAFAELTDPNEQRARFHSAMDEKERIHNERYPIDEDFLEALAGMPPASGIALGFERLAMLAAGAERIDQVIWTPVVEADE